MQVNFDLDEFIAYILNGGLVLTALNNLLSIDLLTEISGLFVVNSQAETIGKGLLIASLALLGGHISSVFARRVLRPIVRLASNASRLAPWSRKYTDFWTKEVCDSLHERFLAAFPSLTIAGAQFAAPRLVRTYVIQRSAAVRETREYIVRARSMCGNAILPLSMFLIFAIQKDANAIAALLIGAIAVLVWKQTDLDHREWKEIYTGFLAIENAPPLRPLPAEAEPHDLH